MPAPTARFPRLCIAVGRVAGWAFSALAIPAPQILLMPGSDGLYSHGGVPAELEVLLEPAKWIAGRSVPCLAGLKQE